MAWPFCLHPRETWRKFTKLKCKVQILVEERPNVSSQIHLKSNCSNKHAYIDGYQTTFSPLYLNQTTTILISIP